MNTSAELKTVDPVTVEIIRNGLYAVLGFIAVLLLLA